MLAEYYQEIYLFIILLITSLVLQQYSSRVIANTQRQTSYLPFAIAILLFFTLLIGFRPFHSSFVDMWNCAQIYNLLWGETFYFNWEVDNLFFDNCLSYFACNSVPLEFFFLFASAIYFGGIFWAAKKIFPQDTLLAFLVCLAAFSTFSYATNGIKAGMATSVFLVALAYYDKKILSLFIALFTYCMHHSMTLVIVAYIVVLFIKNPKYYFMVWGFSFLMAALHITWFQHFFAGFTDEHGAGYLLSERNSGFRIDFIIYSAVPIIIGYYMIYKQKLQSKMYNVILSLYLLTNSVWMLCMYSNFTNRISYLSWFLYPIVLLYPFVNIYWSNRQYTYLKYVVWGHLGFTLFMTVIFYGLLGL